LAIKSIIYKDTKLDLAYTILNKDKKKDLIFLHGWGANKELMQKAFSTKLGDFRHIYLDLSGFGKSTNLLVLDTYAYAKITELFLEELKISPKKCTILGHSFGGKIAVLLNPKNLILLSSAGILEPKSCKVKAKIMFVKVFKILGLTSFTRLFRSNDVAKMSENMYNTFKLVVNEDFSLHFKEFLGRALIFWGKDDTATSLKSGEKISKLIANSKFTAYEGGHFFFLEQASKIEKVIKDDLL